MNSINFYGRLTKDPIFETTKSGVDYCKFSVASDTGFGDRKNTNFFNCIQWGKRAKSISEHAKKGMQVVVSGEFNEKKYTDKEGVEKKYNEVNIKEIQLIFPPKTTQGGNDFSDKPFDDSDLPF